METSTDSSGNVYQMSNTQPYHWIGSGWQPVRQVPPH